MKKPLSFMNNDRGFFLPLVLFSVTLLFIFISANIQSYKHDVQITERQVEQVIVESLFQLGREKVKDELISIEIPDKVQYTFPDGTVNITISSKDYFYELFFSIKTNNNINYSFLNHMPKPEEPTNQ
ncbi:hypothetical protein ACDX78_15425 [Virgibacillus oceani]